MQEDVGSNPGQVCAGNGGRSDHGAVPIDMKVDGDDQVKK